MVDETARTFRALGAIRSTRARKEFFDNTLEKYLKLGDRITAGQVLTVLGEAVRSEGDYESAGMYYTQALEIHRQLGRFAPATSLFNLGWVSLHRGDVAQARTLFVHSLELHREFAYKRGKVEECLGGLAATLGMMGKLEAASELFGAVAALLERSGMAESVEPLDQLEQNHYLAIVRAQLSPEAFEKCWAEGQALTREQAIAYALDKTNDM